MSNIYQDHVVLRHKAKELSYNNSGSGLSATNPQDGVDELAGGATSNVIVQDTFARADNASPGNVEMPVVPWTEISGDVEIFSNTMRATVGSSTSAIATIGTQDYNNKRAKFAFSVETLDQNIYLQWNHNNGSNDGIGFQIDPRVANNRLLIADGTGSFQVIATSTGGGVREGMTTGTVYYVQMDVNANTALLTLTSGDYLCNGGTIIKQLSTTALNQTSDGADVRVLYAAEGSPPGPSVHEFKVETLSCECSFIAVEKKTVTTPTNTLTFSGLDGDADGEYILIGNWQIDNGTGFPYLYANGDTTPANYEQVNHFTDGTSHQVFNSSDPALSGLSNTSDFCTIESWLSRDIEGYFSARARNNKFVIAGNGVIQNTRSIISNSTISNITSLSLQMSANNFATGSTFTLFKLTRP